MLDYESPGYQFSVKSRQFTAVAPTHAGSKLKITKSDEADSNVKFNASKTVDEITMIKRKNSSSRSLNSEAQSQEEMKTSNSASCQWSSSRSALRKLHGVPRLRSRRSTELQHSQEITGSLALLSLSFALFL